MGLVFFVLLVFHAVSGANALKVVTIMFENRAFDHILGHLKQRNPNINGLDGNEWNPIDSLSKTSARIPVTFDAEDVIGLNPSHQIDSTARQIWGSMTESIPAMMTGFIEASNSTRVMRCYNFSMVPALSTLALKGALFDAFYSSVPGPTGPNRMFYHSGTSHGAAVNIADAEVLGYPQRTFFMDLEESKKKWGVYFEDFPVTLELDEARLFLEKFHLMSDFVKHAREGKLPDYSFLEPRWEDEKVWTASTQHPDHPISTGEHLLKEVYEALRIGPHWNETVLIITYDEHGGLMDHQAVPSEEIPNPDGRISVVKGHEFNFTRIGVRVPFVVVSPLVKQAVIHEAPQHHYEHTSVMKTIRKWLNMTIQRPLTRREDWAPSFEEILQYGALRTDFPLTLPLSKPAEDTWARYQQSRKLFTQLTDAEISALPDGPNGGRMLNDLQLDVCTVACRAFPGCSVSVETMSRWTQEQGSDFLRAQRRKILSHKQN